MLRILLNSLTRKPVKCRNRFRREFKEHTTQGVRNWEINLQIDANLTKVHRAMINCISTEQSSFAFLTKTIICITISFPQVTEF